MTQSLTDVHVHICFVIGSMAKILRFITRPTLIFNLFSFCNRHDRAIVNYLAKGGGERLSHETNIIVPAAELKLRQTFSPSDSKKMSMTMKLFIDAQTLKLSLSYSLATTLFQEFCVDEQCSKQENE